MSSGFCVRVLVLLLLTFCQHAKALSYSDFQRSLEPASSENLEPAAAPGAGGPSGSSGRQVDGYSPEGSVSSYRPGPLLIQKSRQKLQQPLQNDPNAGVLQTEAEIPQTEYRESGISSRYGITLYFPEPESTWQAKPEQRSYPAKSQQLPSYPAKSQQPPYPAYPAKPQLPAYPAKPQLPAYPAKPQLPAYPAKPQLPAYPAKPQQRAHPVEAATNTGACAQQISLTFGILTVPNSFWKLSSRVCGFPPIKY
ncbi:hypothetical protein EPR50_G00144680 [Perca flavescens]|uniref:Uncharacterized protein n=1 Tax=Perca flavescens TaxID=8167 RepID=A0A484CNN7_PERFV|nr:hypothetical protein EPR50_G00144680 [Perca flavescens]